ncbi:tetratricopeptide repeat protein [Saccharothrix saharensis]|uniref:Tetratricopeptide repeat protein n=1 Tax=Saccharothrix saharensis TaxID=571190 RepID=A0A543JPG7_9PSEU|nr:tetratricopeptide repeat-containing protein [Saccharothrix saharensis]TQM84730.1 tetratricopeptide repeat protein [Saccharothrix saharensis]
MTVDTGPTAGGTPDADVIFVAMPGTVRGPNAGWTNVEQIKKHLYERVAREVGEEMGRRFRVRVEVDEYRPGNIHQSMFGAALHAPVYIADLTGLNANVYLELGVRWAVRDNVTVLTCQSLQDDLAFNVAPSKAVEYGNDPEKLETACKRIVEMIVKGLRNPDHVDSLVRQGTELVAVGRRELRELRDENARLHHQRGEDLITAARTASHDQRVDLLRQAVEVNPANAEAHLLLGEAAIAADDHPTAITHLTRAVSLDETDSRAWRQLGVAQSKHGSLDAAAHSVQRCIARAPDDAEAHAILGGIHRRRARSHYDDAGVYDFAALRQARDAYAEAGRIDRRDTYPLMNVVRLDLLLAGDDGDLCARALAAADTLTGLARYSAMEEGHRDRWKWFDYADALAFAGQEREALAAARRGLALFEPPHRRAAGVTAADPLQDIVNHTPLPAEVDAAVRALIDAYRSPEG